MTDLTRPRSSLAAIVVGLGAGLAGSALQSVFFKASGPLSPKIPENVFNPPELQQKKENSTETVARRTVELMMQRGPLSESAKKKGGIWVHFGFGAFWGALYGLIYETFPPKDARSELTQLALWSTCVWMFSDNLILPAFRLSAWPQKYPPQVHLYAWIAHLAYGMGIFAFFRPLFERPLETEVVSMQQVLPRAS